jgi:hypothetical protein
MVRARIQPAHKCYSGARTQGYQCREPTRTLEPVQVAEQRYTQLQGYKQSPLLGTAIAQATARILYCGSGPSCLHIGNRY